MNMQDRCDQQGAYYGRQPVVQLAVLTDGGVITIGEAIVGAAGQIVPAESGKVSRKSSR